MARRGTRELHRGLRRDPAVEPRVLRVDHASVALAAHLHDAAAVRPDLDLHLFPRRLPLDVAGEHQLGVRVLVVDKEEPAPRIPGAVRQVEMRREIAVAERARLIARRPVADVEAAHAPRQRVAPADHDVVLVVRRQDHPVLGGRADRRESQAAGRVLREAPSRDHEERREPRPQDVTPREGLGDDTMQGLVRRRVRGRPRAQVAALPVARGGVAPHPRILGPPRQGTRKVR